MCHNYWHPCILYFVQPPLANKRAQSSPVISHKVVEYRERNLRRFLFTESLQIIQSPRSSLVHSPLDLERFSKEESSHIPLYTLLDVTGEDCKELAAFRNPSHTFVYCS